MRRGRHRPTDIQTDGDWASDSAGAMRSSRPERTPARAGRARPSANSFPRVRQGTLGYTCSVTTSSCALGASWVVDRGETAPFGVTRFRLERSNPVSSGPSVLASPSTGEACAMRLSARRIALGESFNAVGHPQMRTDSPTQVRIWQPRSSLLHLTSRISPLKQPLRRSHDRRRLTNPGLSGMTPFNTMAATAVQSNRTGPVA